MDEEKGMNERVNSLLLVNQLDYRLAPSLSVAVSRSHAAYQANQQVYGEGQTLSVTMSSGGQYINFRESYLSIEVKIVCGGADPNAYAFPQWTAEASALQGQDPRLMPARNGCMNLFSAFRWVHASGTVIDEQIQDLDLWCYVRNKYTYGMDKHVSMGSLQQYGVANDSPNGLVANPSDLKFTNVNNTRKLLIPLCEISDCYDQQQLCPAFICAGSRLEMRLNEFKKAFTATSTIILDPVPLPTYTITKCELVLQQVQLTDSIQRALQNISASSGLEYPFTSIGKSVV